MENNIPVHIREDFEALIRESSTLSTARWPDSAGYEKPGKYKDHCVRVAWFVWKKSKGF